MHADKMPEHQLSSQLIRLFLVSRVAARHAFIFCAAKGAVRNGAPRAVPSNPDISLPRTAPRRAALPRLLLSRLARAKPGSLGLACRLLGCRPPAGGLDSNLQFLAAALAGPGGDAYRVRVSPSLENEGSLRDTDG